MSRRRDPFKEIEELFDRLNAGFGDVGRELETELSQELGTSGGIHVDVADAEDKLVVAADVPGFDKGDIEVSVKGRRLRIAAEHSDQREEGDDTHYYRRERTRRSASRTVPLPVEVIESEATATYENGVLTIELPKADADDGGHDIEVN